ncbi:MAG: hypothetical protein H0S79_16470 [Anaerolineaceae bacterium]|nr:hypothetical protein [Anaerolineaceae bacterium]
MDNTKMFDFQIIDDDCIEDNTTSSMPEEQFITPNSTGSLILKMIFEKLSNRSNSELWSDYDAYSDWDR